MAMRTCMMIPSCGHNVGAGIREDIALMRGEGILIVPQCGWDDDAKVSGGFLISRGYGVLCVLRKLPTTSTRWGFF